MLNISDSALEEATSLYRDLESSRIVNPLNIDYPQDKQHLFIEFNERYFTAIIFAVTAVESYVNSLIKNDVFIELPTKSGELKNFTKFEIEQQIDLRDKIKKVLPLSRNISIDIREMPFWNDFCDLIKYRNSLIHPKSEKITVVLNKEQKIQYVKSSQFKVLNEIYNAGRKKDIVGSARKVITFLAEKTDYPEVTPLEFRNYKPANLMDYIKENKIDIEYIDGQ